MWEDPDRAGDTELLSSDETPLTVEEIAPCSLEDRQRRRNLHRLGETKTACQLNAMWDPGLDPGTEGH